MVSRPAARRAPSAPARVHGDADSRAWSAAAAVIDPELPAVTIEDLGILREVEVTAAGVRVVITPTYAGCPAMDLIRSQVVTALRAAGFSAVDVVTALAPAWTTDMITDVGRAKLAAAGIAPPGSVPAGGPVRVALRVRCPHCGSPQTTQLSFFGSTACMSLWRCEACREPFQHVKPL